MSSIIVDKLKEIEEAYKIGTCNPISKEISTSGLKSGSCCQAQSREQTVSILTKKDSDYQEYHTVQVWAGKLRSLKSEQRLYAEKAIYDVLFEAQLGNLNKSSVKINDKVFCTKQSHSILNAKSCNNNLSERSLDTSDHSQTVPSSKNDEHDYRSSEVIIAESFPTEIGVISSECQVKLDDISDQKRRQKFITALSSLVLPVSSRSQSRQYPQTDSEETTYKNDSFSSNIAINTPDHILTQLRPPASPAAATVLPSNQFRTKPNLYITMHSIA